MKHQMNQSMLQVAVVLFFGLVVSATSADLQTWPSQYTIRPWEASRLTASDVVGPDGIVYPNFTGVGVTGGIPDVNNGTVRATYTVFNVKNYGATGDGSTNDDTAVASAAAAARANASAVNKSILYFPSGTYILRVPILFSKSNVVVDGDGPTSTVLKIATDTAQSGSLITFKTGLIYTGYLNATSSIPRGATTATFNLDPATNGYTVGSWARLAPTVSGPGTTLSDRFSNPDNNMVYNDPVGHTGRFTFAKVTGVNSGARTVTFDRAFTHDYFLSEIPQLRNHSFIENVGLQDLTIETMAASATIEPTTFENVANGWMKNIRIVKSKNWPFRCNGVTRFEIRDSQFLGTWGNINNGGVAYVGWCGNATDALMDNCQASDLRHMAIFQSSNRCIIRNSTFTGKSITSPQLHGGFPHENLIEGCTFATSGDSTTTPGRGITAYTSDGGATLRHGVEGPRNVFYNNRVNTGMSTVRLGGIKEGLIFAYNRILKTDDIEAQAAMHIVDRSFDGVLRGNIFQAINSLPFIAYEDPTCSGWRVTDNKIYGSNGFLYEGDSAPEIAHNNRFFSSATTPDAATSPEVASIYSWQKSNAAAARLVIVVDKRTVADNGGTTSGTVVRVKSSTASALAVNFSTDSSGISVPGFVTIPAGQVSAPFTISGVDVSGGEKTITLTASASGLLSDSEKIFSLDQNVSQPNFGKLKWPEAATGLPTSWKAGNFGQVTSAGTQSFNSSTNTWNITGGGVAIQFNNPATDTTSFHSSLARSGRRFVYQTIDGDGEIRARITAATGEQQVGLMMADDEGTMTDFIMVEPTGRVLSSSNRNVNPHGQPVVQASPGTRVVPLWLRLKRVGFVFTAYKSSATNPANEGDWTVLATVNMYRNSLGNAQEPADYKSPAILDKRMHYGMFINSGAANTTASATFTGLSLSGASGTPPATSTDIPMTNAGFESDESSTPLGWSTWANTVANEAADYAEAWEPRSGARHLSHYIGNGTYQVYTYRTVTGLTNGTYTVRSWTKSTGGQTGVNMSAKNYGGSPVFTPIPTSVSTYTERVLSGIAVTNGQIEIGFWSNASASEQWIAVDDVSLSRTGP